VRHVRHQTFGLRSADAKPLGPFEVQLEFERLSLCTEDRNGHKRSFLMRQLRRVPQLAVNLPDRLVVESLRDVRPKSFSITFLPASRCKSSLFNFGTYVI
jgi:hypothetical protein